MITAKEHHNSTYIVRQHHNSTYNKKLANSFKIHQNYDSNEFTILQHLYKYLLIISFSNTF